MPVADREPTDPGHVTLGDFDSVCPNLISGMFMLAVVFGFTRFGWHRLQVEESFISAKDCELQKKKPPHSRSKILVTLSGRGFKETRVRTTHVKEFFSKFVTNSDTSFQPYRFSMKVLM